MTAKLTQRNITDPISAMLKMKTGLAYLQNSRPLDLVFAPDAIRDATINIDDRAAFTAEVLGPNSKNRTSAHAQISAGGHGAIGTISAGTLRGDENVQLTLAAKVFKSTKEEVLNNLINSLISIKGGNSINTDYIVEDSRPGTPINIVFESPDRTTIAVVRGQPVLHTNDYGERLDQLVSEFQNADVCGILSLKSPFMKEMTQILHERGIKPKEMVSDVTTGDDTAVMVDTLKLIGHGSHDPVAPPITLLSMNDEEAVRYAKIVWTMENDKGRVESFLESKGYSDAKKSLSENVSALSELESQGGPEDEMRQRRNNIRKCEETIRECSKRFESIIAKEMEASWNENYFTAAEYLAKNLKVPLFFHCKYGSKIFDANGSERGTRFVSSVNLTPNAGTLGAGDTMLGAIMLALGIKNRLESEGAPKELQLSYEDCLMVANVVTGYRLVHGKSPGTLDECYRWVSLPSAKTTPAPKKWMDTGSLGKAVFHDAKLAQAQMEILQLAHKHGFEGKQAQDAKMKVGKLLIDVFQQEENSRAYDTPLAVKNLIPTIGGRDRVMAVLALNALREIARMQPKEAREAIRRELGIGQARLAMMFDLDATLFDSQAARERAGARAIMKMLLKTEDGNRLDSDYSKRLFVALYNRHDDFKAMGFPDFRQVWNSPQMYAAAAAIVRAGGKNGKPVRNSEELASILKSFEAPSSNPLSDTGYAQLMANTINQIMNNGNYIKKINNAVQEYVDTGLVPYLDARRTLSIIRELLGAECYIVTEGHDETQKQKITMLGLSEFFGEGDRVLSTGYAKAPWREAAGLGIERERLRKSQMDGLEKYASALQKALELHERGGEGSGLSAAMMHVESAKREIATYGEEKTVFDWVNSIFTLKAKKSSGAGTFNSDVLRAINKNPDNPREAIGAGDHAGGKSSPFIGFMIGDRLDNDLVAMKQVSTEVVPIIVKKGAYAKNYDNAAYTVKMLRNAVDAGAPASETEPMMKQLDKLLNVSGSRTVDEYETLMPKLEAFTLSDVARFLLSKSTYGGVLPVSQPKKAQVESFGEGVLDNVLLGRLSPSKTVKLVCEDVLKSIAYGPEEEICQAVAYFLPHLQSDHLEKNHPNRAPSQMKVAAAENIAILLENCPNHTPKIAEAAEIAASRLAEAFSSRSEDPDICPQFVIAYGRISDDNGPIADLLGENAMEIGLPLANALEATSMKIQKTVRLKKDVADAVKITGDLCARMQTAMIGAGDSNMYRTAVEQIIRDMNLRDYKNHPQLSGIRSQVVVMYKAGKAAKI